jgi:hypothetical protein
MKNCLSTCWDAHLHNGGQKWACYSPVLITSEGETSNLPQGARLFHREMWAKLGGYPLEAVIGEVDSIFGTVMLKQNVVMYSCGTEPTYWHREWEGALTHSKSARRAEISFLARTLCTHEWKDPRDWIKGYGYDL